jgi:nucleoid-associated protein YgaU
MTRETKIGLLVGLAFIIVIGILLSDHLTATTEPPTAPLARAGQTARQAVTTVGQPTAPVIVRAPQQVMPSGPIVTREELQPQRRPIEFAQPTANGPAQGAGQTANGSAIAMATPSLEQGQPTVTETPSLPGNDPMARLAAAHSDVLQVVGSSQTEPQHQQVEQTAATTGAPVATRTYVVQEGDSLSRIAAKTLGANTKANRDAIIRANPSLAADPNKVIVGRTYIIPTGPLPQVFTTPTNPPALPKDKPQAALAKVSATGKSSSSSTTYWYTVKENDSLWKIAMEQLGTGNAYQQIKDLNKDVLKGSDNVRPNMRLRLPAKSQPVASAS